MQIAPDEETRKQIKFWLDCLQVVTVIVTIVTAYVMFRNYTNAQQARAERLIPLSQARLYVVDALV